MTFNAMDRIAALEAFLEKDPDDPFPRYGLAVEYKNQDRFEEAQALFDELITRFPDYLASYMMAGANLIALGREPEAAETYRRGIEVAAKKGDSHTRSELELALADLEKSE